MSLAPPAGRNGRARRTTLWLLASLAVLGPAAGAWWLLTSTRTRPLAADWKATAVVIAGDGVPGWRDGEASRARFSDPFGVAVGGDGTVYVADAGASQRIRTISADGFVRTLAGGDRGFADGTGEAARFNTPSALAIEKNGTLYVADTGNNAIRRIAPDGRVSTLAGDGIAGDRDGPGHEARFNGPVGVAVDARGRVIVADTYNDRIRAIEADGTVSTLAGAGEPGALDGAALQARFHTPSGVATDRAGNVYVADTGNGALRIVSPSGIVTTMGWFPEGLVRPVGIAAGEAGDVYVTDDRGRIVAIVGSGQGRTLAGSSPGFADGQGDAARFRGPAGLALAAPGRLIVTDAGNALVRLLADPSRLEMRPPASPRITPRFDVDTFARLPMLWPLPSMDGPHEVAGTLGEARGGEGTERFHGGIDVRAEEGTIVRAARDGVVAATIGGGEFGTLNEWIRVGPISYVHVRTGRTRDGELFDLDRFAATYDELGKLSLVRVKRGARFTTGDAIATANQFNHVHVSVGWPGEEHNPLRLRLVQFADRVPPTIGRGGIRLYDESGAALTRRVRGRVAVSGRVRIVVDAWDQADGNRPSRRLGVYALGYQVLTRKGSPAPGFEEPKQTIRFDRLAPSTDAARLVYWPGSGIPFYGRRRTRFLYTVTNTFAGGSASEGFWDTGALAPGDYVVRIWASDVEGNTARHNRDLAVMVEAQRELDSTRQ